MMAGSYELRHEQQTCIEVALVCFFGIQHTCQAAVCVVVTTV
jgi:hypothetical protein